MITANAHLVDGSLLPMEFGDDFVHRLRALRRQGVEGKALIHKLITDDWGAPPNYVHIVGELEDGTPVDVTIPYR